MSNKFVGVMKVERMNDARSQIYTIQLRLCYISECLLVVNSRVNEMQRPFSDATGLRNSLCSCAGRDAWSGALAKAVRGTVTLVWTPVVRNACALTAIFI